MNLNDNNYAQFVLVREMMDTVGTVARFDASCTKDLAARVKQAGRIMFSGEGSSRIFPATNAARKSKTWGLDLNIQFEGARQAAQYDLSKYVTVLASNSGRTKEVLMLAKQLEAQGHPCRFGLTANEGTPLEKACTQTHVLGCGWEQAVAATKSVVEQALWCESLIWHLAGRDMREALAGLPAKLETAMTQAIPQEIVSWAVGANTIYFAGYNDGVAEELTLKTNEITRRKSDFLEGTYALHGIEEVMEPCDVVFIIDPIESEYEKYKSVLEGNARLHVVAIADHETPFTTIRVPSAGDLQQYVYLCAGWNLLVEIGLALKINLDKPQHARKVGNEW